MFDTMLVFDMTVIQITDGQYLYTRIEYPRRHTIYLDRQAYRLDIISLIVRGDVLSGFMCHTLILATSP